MDKKWKDTSVRNSALAVETRKRKGVRLIMSVLSLMTWLTVTVRSIGLKLIAVAIDSLILCPSCRHFRVRGFLVESQCLALVSFL